MLYALMSFLNISIYATMSDQLVQADTRLTTTNAVGLLANGIQETVIALLSNSTNSGRVDLFVLFYRL